MVQSLNIVKNHIEELPNNIEAEQSVIGSILLSNEIFDEISILVNNKNFYDPMHQKIFTAIEKLIYAGMLANPITLKNYLSEKDLSDIETIELLNTMATRVKEGEAITEEETKPLTDRDVKKKVSDRDVKKKVSDKQTDRKARGQLNESESNDDEEECTDEGKKIIIKRF